MNGRRVLAFVAVVSAVLMFILAGMVLADKTLSPQSQFVGLILLGGMFAAEAIRGLRGAS